MNLANAVSLAGIIIGILSNTFFYLRQKRETHEIHVQSGEFRNFEDHLQRLFPAVSKKVMKNRKLPGQELQALKELLWRGDGELEAGFRAILQGEIDLVSLDARESEPVYTAMLSIQGLGNFLRSLRDKKSIKGLRDETLDAVVPGLITGLLREISLDHEMSSYVKLLQGQSIDYAIRQVLKGGKVTKEMIDEVREHYLKKEYRERATQLAYKLSGGGTPDLKAFPYFRPGMRLVRKQKGQVPDDFETNTDPIKDEEFFDILKSKGRVFVTAGAGVGKSTFLIYLHLILLRKFAALNFIPVFETIPNIISFPGDLSACISHIFQTPSIGFSKEKADAISRSLHNEGSLCLVLDSVDQAANIRALNRCFSPEMGNYLGPNRAVVSCRSEDIKGNPSRYERLFNRFEWVILDPFEKEELESYLGQEMLRWLTRLKQPEEGLRDLLRVRFYANICKRVALKFPQRQIATKVQLLDAFRDELFLDAESRGIPCGASQEMQIRDYLCLLSLDTLSAKPAEYKQTFPRQFLERYLPKWDNVRDIVFNNTQWLHFNRKIFETPFAEGYTFRHQLLQEYFAACELAKRFNKGPSFNEGLEDFPYSTIRLYLLDEMLENHEVVFDYCMEEIKAALKEAEKKKTSITDRGHFFTWVLALRDRKSTREGLKERLQEIFDEEVRVTQAEAETDGKFVRVPAGPFLMGSYEEGNEQPVRVVYVEEYWISRYAETFGKYEAFERLKHPEYTYKRDYSEKSPALCHYWSSAREYCKEALGERYDLPDEAQWEKAARGCYGRRYPWGNSHPNKDLVNANLEGHWDVSTEDVDRYPSFLYGIYQMAGNVWEWCLDEYSRDYDPGAEIFKELHVLRGGSTLKRERMMRCSNRIMGHMEMLRDPFMGIRPVRTSG